MDAFGRERDRQGEATLADVVAAVIEVTRDERESIAVVVHLLASGRVRRRRSATVTSDQRPSDPVDLDGLLLAAARHGDHDPEADGDHQADSGPDASDLLQDPEVPQPGGDAAEQDEVPEEIDAHPLHGVAPGSARARSLAWSA